MSGTATPTPEQQQRVKWDELLLDIETRTEQLRQLKTFEGRRLMIQGLTAGGVLVGAGAAVAALLVKAIG